MECECIMCTSDDFALYPREVNFSQDPLFEFGIKPYTMSMKQFRDLTRNQITEYETKTIAFLNKFDRFHPVNDTVSMEKNLEVMWTILAAVY